MFGFRKLLGEMERLRWRVRDIEILLKKVTLPDAMAGRIYVAGDADVDRVEKRVAQLAASLGYRWVRGNAEGHWEPQAKDGVAG